MANPKGKSFVSSTTKAKKHLQYKSLYYFRYKAKGEGKLSIYDKAPLVIFMQIKSGKALGINLHWIPRRYRKDVISIILELTGWAEQSPTIRTKKVPRLYYKIVKSNPVLWKYTKMAIRMYFLKNMKRIVPIPLGPKWYKVPLDKVHLAMMARKENGYKPVKGDYLK